MDKIQADLKAYLATNPGKQAATALIEILEEYKYEVDRQAVTRDLEWQKQFPDIFPNKQSSASAILIREKFRRMFNNLRDQGISVTYAPDFSDVQLLQWMLHRDGQTGRLMWYRKLGEWEIHTFRFEGATSEFSYVTRR